MTIALGALGFIITWILGAFRVGRTIEQMRAAIKEQIGLERDKVIKKIDELEEKFDGEQRTQDHNFGEVGAAMRQYIADVEKMVREVEIYGRDNYVKIPDFEKAIDRLSGDIKSGVNELKEDIRRLLSKSN